MAELEGRDYKVFPDKAGAKAYGDTELVPRREALTQEEEAAVGAYSGTTFGPVNKALRAGNTHRLVPDLDSAIAKGRIPEDIIVRRGLDSHPDLPGVDLIRPGVVIREPGYTSTSLTSAASFGGRYQLRIKVPAGSPGLWIQDLSDSPSEMEILLARGSRLLVTEIEEVGSRRMLHCVLLPPEE